MRFSFFLRAALIYAVLAGLTFSGLALAQEVEVGSAAGEELASQIGNIVKWILTASGTAAWLAAALKDNGFFKFIMPFINAVGANIGAAKNDPAKN